MSFLAPYGLLLLLGVAALGIAYVVAQRRRSRYAVRFTALPLLDKVAPRRPGWRRHAPAVAFLLTMVCLVLAVARPTVDVQVPRERATVLVAVDTSTSMRATDVAPSRLAAAQEAASGFVAGLPEEFNVGLVSFAGSASVVVPPTTDRAAVRSAIEQLRLADRTAIGEAVFTALDAISSFDDRAAEEPPPARIVLLSDGANTTGRPLDAAGQAATQAQVPVSTIAYGTPNGVLNSGGQSTPVPVDTDALRRLAETTTGAFYAAATGEELQEVYTDIGSSIGYRTERQEITAWMVAAALAAAALGAIASLAWFARLP